MDTILNYCAPNGRGDVALAPCENECLYYLKIMQSVTMFVTIFESCGFFLGFLRYQCSYMRTLLIWGIKRSCWHQFYHTAFLFEPLKQF